MNETSLEAAFSFLTCITSLLTTILTYACMSVDQQLRLGLSPVTEIQH